MEDQLAVGGNLFSTAVYHVVSYFHGIPCTYDIRPRPKFYQIKHIRIQTLEKMRKGSSVEIVVDFFLL